VIQIGSRAVAGVVEGVYDAAVTFYIRVRACEVSERIDAAGQTVHAGVVVLTAASLTVFPVLPVFLVTGAVIRTPGNVGERAEIVVEGMILLHHDDDVI
jgi:hypothetical protein